MHPEIPRTLYQTWDSVDTIPLGARAAQQTWRIKNPGWEFAFFDEVGRRNTVSKFGDDAIRAYDRLDRIAFKADLWRYCQLYLDGGIYADIDSECLVPFDDTLSEAATFVASAATPRTNGGLTWAVFQAFIAVTPRHPFLKAAIDRGIREILGGEPDGFTSIGPSGLGMAINMARGRKLRAPNPAGQDGETLLLKKQGQTLSISGTAIINCQYDGYKAELRASGKDHWRDQNTRVSFRRRFTRRIRRLIFPRSGGLG
ncbi:MAG: glycosyltransferase [Parvularcula sp.]|jgi:hypothetical protein|nr:glycosyltransferase [Parvularcula sp.]